jgi:hypothetical protein
MTVRTMRFFSRASVVGAVQTLLRSAASVVSDIGSMEGATVAAEAGALDTTPSGTAKIVVNHLDLGPGKRSQAIAHGILQRAALPVVQDLMRRRLPNVEKRFAL